jgi:hypothetical protein
LRHLLAERIDEAGGSRAGAKAELHTVLDEIEGCARCTFLEILSLEHGLSPDRR